MATSLEKEEVAYLFQFVKERNVPWIDVQHELVDHLASAIEDEMAKNDFLTFQSALKRVYSKFPITGFVHFVEERKKAVSKFWLRKQLGYLKTYFTLPKVILTIAGFALSFLLLSSGHPWLVIGFFGLMIVVSALSYRPPLEEEDFKIPKWVERFGELALVGILMVLIFTGFGDDDRQVILLVMLAFAAIFRLAFKHKFSERRELTQNYLIISNSRNYVSGGSYWILVYFFVTTDYDFLTNLLNYPIICTLMALVFTFAIIYSHANLTHFPKMIQQELDEKYPHLQIKLI